MESEKKIEQPTLSQETTNKTTSLFSEKKNAAKKVEEGETFGSYGYGAGGNQCGQQAGCCGTC
jgi:hypothetical protein